jgi:hypothetical protein
MHQSTRRWLIGCERRTAPNRQSSRLPGCRTTFIAARDSLRLARTLRFVVMRRQPEWLTVFFNSFAELDALTELLSTKFECRVVTILAQSVTDAYFILIYDSGEHLRTLEWVGESGEWVRQEGRPLGFETSPLGRNISEHGEQPHFVFAGEEVQQYCRDFGLQLWEGEDSASTEIMVPEPPQPTAAARRRWWKFWK